MSFDAVTSGHLARPLGAGGDGEDPVDGRRVRRVAVRSSASGAGRAGRRPVVAAVIARASVGSRPADIDSASATSSAAVSAVRTSRGTVSRPAIASINGSSSWRTRLRTKRGSSLDGSSTGDETELGAQPAGVGAPQGEQRPGRAGRHRRQPVEPGPAEQVDEQRLGPVVGGVPGQRTGGQRATAGSAGPCLQVGARGDVGRRRRGTARRALAARADCSRRPRFSTRAGGRGRRGSP